MPSEGLMLIEKIGADAVHYSGNYPAVFFKKVSRFDLDTLKEIAELQRKIWNNSRVTFLYVTSPAEIRIYNCNESPVLLNRVDAEVRLPKELEIRTIEQCVLRDSAKLERLQHVFSRIAIDSGSIWMTDYSKKVKLQTKVDHYLVNSLVKLARKIKEDVDEHRAVHHLLMRCIFIMYLQDRQAIPQEIWKKTGDNDFLNILDSKDLTYALFDEILVHFNGNVFPISDEERSQITDEHLTLIKHCLTDGDINLAQQKFFNWRLFDFSFIRIELLSEIYEKFLAEFDPIRKKQTGTYYTPPTLVELVLDNVLPNGGTNYKLKILDPACGSGIFLAQAYKRVVQYWKNAHPGVTPEFSVLSQILTDSIFGVEIDDKSIKVASFSLYLALLDFLSPRDVWLKNEEKFPNLIRDIDSEKDENQGHNLYRCDTIALDGEFEKIKYDVIVGNPPFGANGLSESIKAYCHSRNFSSQYVIPFIHKSASLLKPNGRAGLVFNTKILTNSHSKAQNFRQWLFNENFVEKVFNLSILRKAPKDFGGHLFSSAVVPISIVFFQNGNSPPRNYRDTIEYWAPKTFIKHNVVDGVIIEATDIKYLPREICHKPDTKIWKIAQWGTMADYLLIDRLMQISPIKDLLDEENNGVGFQTLDGTTTKPIRNNSLRNIPFILPEHIVRYYTDKPQTYSINKSLKTDNAISHYLSYYKLDQYNDLPEIDSFRRLGKMKAFQGPHVLIKEGLSKNRVCASFLDYSCSFNSKVYGIHHKSELLLKAITCLINSDFGMYFLFLHSASLGIEREEIKPTDVKRLPQVPEEDFQAYGDLFDSIRHERDQFFAQDKSIKTELSELIQQSLKLTVRDVILIRDFCDFTLPLFFKGAKSIALNPISTKNPETIGFAEIVCAEINEFLISGTLKVNAMVYVSPHHFPLTVVAFHFVPESDLKAPIVMDSIVEIESHLNKINEHTLEKYSQNIFVRKQIRFYDGDTIFIVKPNQNRYWTRSQGMDDANSVINEIMVFNK